MLSPLTPEFIERFEAIVESDKPVANKFALPYSDRPGYQEDWKPR
jgi:hypothetical protein